MPKVPKEVISEHYQLKATFFANRLETEEYVGLFDAVYQSRQANDSSLDWSKSTDFGVNSDVLADITDAGLSASQHLCHPNAILTNPKFLSYYRCIAALSQKGLKSISGVSSVDKIEAGLSDITAVQAQKIAAAINENLNAIYSISLPEQEKLRGLMYATAGTTIDGSWRNKIGSEGERIVRTLFLKELLSNGEISKVTLRKGSEVQADKLTAKWLDDNTSMLHSALTTNGAVVLFGSEPDITLLDQHSKTVGGIEIKAGIDPAAALERLGAMMKSFENIRSESSDAETILVATCITDEVDQRLRGMKGVRTFIMTDVIQDNKKQGTRLMNIMRACIGLTAAYQ